MKVVLFCGGFGLRIRDNPEGLPKPMVPVGPRPILWHGMRYYAHFGFDDFVLCLGYRADLIKQYFLRYDEALSNDFVLTGANRSVELLSTDATSWRMTFIDTGLQSTIGGRLLRVRQHVEHEEMFLANYADVLGDAAMDELVDKFRKTNAVAAFLAVRPNSTFHVIEADHTGLVTGLTNLQHGSLWMNGGFFIMRPEIFDYLREGDELVGTAFERLIRAGRLMTFRHEGFWAPMDTLKDLQILESLHETGGSPWELWRTAGRMKTPDGVAKVRAP